MKTIGWVFASVVLTSCVGGDIDERTDRLSDVDQDGYVAIAYGGEDCDDQEQDINPGEEETPYDGIDNDCSEDTPDDDLDGDSFPLVNDCDDLDETIHPSATEVCDSVDNNCNDEIDEAGAEGESTFYSDLDGDGFGDPEHSILACSLPKEGYSADSTDCNDDDALAFPGSTERCSTAYDDNCDSEINEENAEGCTNYFFDRDGDGYGTEAMACLCEPDIDGDMDALEGTDCMDDNPDASPEGIEFLGDSDDYDCDGGDDTFAFQVVDTRSSLSSYGPRIRASGDSFYLAWIAEEFTEGTELQYDGGLIAEYDADDPGLGEMDFLSSGSDNNTLAFAEKFDFVVTEDYWVVASGGINGTERNIRLDFIDRSNGTKDTYEETLTTTATWDDIQLTQTTSGVITAVACGLGDAGFQVIQSTVSGFITATSVYSGIEPWPNDFCEHNEITHSYYLGASDIQTIDYAAYSSSNQAFYHYHNYNGVEIGDIEVARTASNYVTGLAVTQSGKNYIYATTSNASADKTMPLKVVDLDIAMTPNNGAAMCAVASNGDLSLIYAYVEDNESLEEVAMNPGVAVDECAIAATNDGRLALAIRSGDSFMIGFADYP